jgi:uncharacterized protein YndB with AHSA1/START domain
MSSHPKTDEDHTRVVEQTIEVKAPTDVVWAALTEATQLTRWFPLDATVTPGEGGTIWMSWGEMYEADSGIEVWKPNEHLRARFPVVGGRALATDFYLQGKGGRTVLRVVTSGFGAGADWDNDYDGVRFGWAFELQGLRHYLERHRGEDRIVARVQRKLETEKADLWTRMVAPLLCDHRGHNVHRDHPQPHPSHPTRRYHPRAQRCHLPHRGREPRTW